MLDELNNSLLKSLIISMSLGLLLLAIGLFASPEQARPWQQQQSESQDLKTQLGRIIIRPGSGASIAIPDLISPSQPSDLAAAEISRVMTDDLDFAGVINVLSQSLYPQAKISDPQQVDFTAWRQDPVRADYLALGSFLKASDQIIVEMYLFDVPAGTRLLANRYRGVPGQARGLAHEMADDIVRLLTGSPGISRSKMAFVSQKTGHREIYIMDYDGFGLRQFTSERSLVLFPSWSADGRKLAYLSFKDDRPHIQIRATTDGLPLGRFQFAQGTVSSPAFSPDGERLAFCSSKDSNSMQLYIADLRTQRIQQITNTRSVVHTSPRWNPRTGRELAYISDQSGSPQIYVSDVDGGSSRRLLTQGGSADSPAWSPDGRYIAFAWRPPEASQYDIFIMDIASGQIVQLTNGFGSNESPTWSPDGRHLAFQSNRTGRFEIYLVHIDGTGIKQVTTSGGTSPAWGR